MRREQHSTMGYGDFINGLLAGAGLMYLIDPDRGRRRRAMLRDRAVHLAHVTKHTSDVTVRDVRNRATGLIAASRARLRRDHPSDAVVEARVRSALGRLVSHPGAIRSTVAGGVLTLRGDVLADEVTDLIAGCSRVRGVREVRNQLNVHRSSDSVPALQGTGSRPDSRPDLLQEHWSPTSRLIMGSLGAALTIRGSRSGGTLGTAMSLAGAGILARALTNLRFERLTGLNVERRAIDVQKTLTIHAPVAEVFDFWKNFTNLPRFMSHLKEVRDLGDGRSRWTATGPAGISVSWDAEVTAFQDGELIAWKSIGSTPVGNAGIVRFEPIDDNTTRIDVRMSYNPVAGAIGHVVASFFGVDPKSAMDEDMVRLKSLLEGEGADRGEERGGDGRAERSSTPADARAD